MLLPTDPDVQEALDSIGQQVLQIEPCMDDNKIKLEIPVLWTNK